MYTAVERDKLSDKLLVLFFLFVLEYLQPHTAESKWGRTNDKGSRIHEADNSIVGCSDRPHSILKHNVL